MNKAAILLAAYALSPVAAAAQDAPVPAAVEPARLEAAHSLIDVLMPPTERERIIEGMMKPLLANLRRGVMESPSFGAAFGRNPKARALFDGFMKKQEQRTTALMREALPGMVPAMAAAYARRFDVAQLREIRRFFETPTGQAYVRQSTTIMNDPDVAAWQRALIEASMSHVQEDVAAFAKQVAALEPKQ